jgi:antitoxin VapB
MTTTKVFKSGNSMAVRLPASFNAVPGTPVEVREEQGRWIVEALPAQTGKIDLTGIWGSVPGLKPLTPEERIMEPRELDWGGRLLTGG